MDEKILINSELGKAYIAKERKISILAGSGYMILLLALAVWNGVTAMTPSFRVIAAVCIGILGFALTFGGALKEKEEWKKVRSGNFMLETSYLEELTAKYKKIKNIYLGIYIISFIGILGIVGRSVYIVAVYKACPSYDVTVYVAGSIAMFCFSYASGITEAYKTLLKWDKKEK